MESVQKLTELPAALVEAGYDTPNYRAIYEAARSARIPVRRGENGHWTFSKENVPEIARRLNLKPMAAE